VDKIIQYRRFGLIPTFTRQRAGDTQGAADAYAHSVFRTLDGAATHAGALRKLGAGVAESGPEDSDWVIHGGRVHSEREASKF
jgi:hypothetical protein